MSEPMSVPEPHEPAAAGDLDVAVAYERYATRLVGLARSMFRRRSLSPASGSAVVQSVFESLAEKERITLGDEGSAWHYLVRATLRHSDKEIKRRTRHRTTSLDRPGRDGEDGFDVPGRDPTPDEAATLTELLDLWMKNLDDEERKVAELWLQGFTNLEIATRLNWPVRTTQRKKKSALTKLEGLRTGP